MSIVESHTEFKVVARKEPKDGVNYSDNDENGCKAILDKIGTDGLRMCCGRTRAGSEGARSPYCPTHHRLYNNLAPAAQRKSHG